MLLFGKIVSGLVKSHSFEVNFLAFPESVSIEALLDKSSINCNGITQAVSQFLLHVLGRKLCLCLNMVTKMFVYGLTLKSSEVYNVVV